MTEVVRPVSPAREWAADLFTCGVTGTNGKTSTVRMLASVLDAAHAPALEIGTVGNFLGGEPLDVARSFDGFIDAFDLLRKAGGRWGAVEATSHGLANGWARRWRFDLGVFTNLSPDHLKTHGSYEHYLASKAQLFVLLGPGCTAVLNGADENALLIDQATPPDVSRRWFAAPGRGPKLRDVDLEAAQVEVTPDGTRVSLSPGEVCEQLGGALHVPMVGSVFAENALAAALAGLAAGAPPEAVVSGIRDAGVVPGRFEVFGNGPVVVVDYAHSADALERTLRTARQLTRGKLSVVFGAGGQASSDKRGPMGAAAAKGSDRAFITNDNPRREDPQAIASAIVAGWEDVRADPPVVMLDRRAAIEAAVGEAGKDDVVVVAGMGHERGQRIGSETLPHSDRDVVRELVGDRAVREG